MTILKQILDASKKMDDGTILLSPEDAEFLLNLEEQNKDIYKALREKITEDIKNSNGVQEAVSKVKSDLDRLKHEIETKSINLDG